MKLAHLMPKHLVVDSSVLIFFDRKGKLDDFLQEKRQENYKVVIPKAIAQEVVDEPKGFAEKIREPAPESAKRILDSVARINTAIEQGLIQVETVNYRKYSKVMDNVRKHLSRLEATPEYAIKKGDPELIALVIQHYDESKEKVFVATLDKGLLKALKPFGDEVEYEILEKAVKIRTTELVPNAVPKNYRACRNANANKDMICLAAQFERQTLKFAQFLKGNILVILLYATAR